MEKFKLSHYRFVKSSSDDTERLSPQMNFELDKEEYTKQLPPIREWPAPHTGCLHPLSVLGDSPALTEPRSEPELSLVPDKVLSSGAKAILLSRWLSHVSGGTTSLLQTGWGGWGV